MNKPQTTTEVFIHAVRDIVIARAVARDTITADQAFRLSHTKLLYGVGDGTYRGVCIYDAWENGVGKVDIVEIAATGQESWIQLAGTVIHELGHVLAGAGAGHDTDWKDMTKALGFVVRPNAAGQVYRLAMIDPKIRVAVYELAKAIADGTPAFRTFGIGWAGLTTPRRPRPCSAGVGTRGGTSRGAGSGSRMLKVECAAGSGYKVRMTRSWLDSVGAPICPCHNTVMVTG